MKVYSKILVLVAILLILALSACSRSASQAPTTLATPSPQVDFPFETQDPVSAAATQTSIASEPLPAQPTDTPQAVIMTNTPEAEGEQPQAEPEQPTASSTPEATDLTVNPPGPTPVVERPETYTLRQGEWPICIARRYDVNLSSFFSLNGLNMNSKPAAGFTLKIPASGNWSTADHGARALKAHPAKHTVTAGQSVYSIACQYGDVAPESILAANGLSNASDIKAGMIINIP